MPFAQTITGLYASLLLMNNSFIDLFFFCVVHNDTSETADPVALELYLFVGFKWWCTHEIFHQLLVPERSVPWMAGHPEL